MKTVTLIVVTTAVAAWAFADAGSDESGRPARFGIYLKESDKTEWLLLRIGAKLYFMRVIPRPPAPGDHKVTEAIDYSCNHFEIERAEPGSIKAEGCGAFAAGWLVANGSTTPPSIDIDPNTAKSSKWIVPYAEKEGYHLGALGADNKTWWLFMGEHPVVDVMPSGKSVYEFRPAILSRDKKCTFRFSKDDGSKCILRGVVFSDPRVVISAKLAMTIGWRAHAAFARTASRSASSLCNRGGRRGSSQGEEPSLRPAPSGDEQPAQEDGRASDPSPLANA